jgi:prepilin-type N-terminal cleavage/methylation domain-containing protein
MNTHYFSKGYTIAELMISIAILGVLAYTISIFQRDIFSLNFSAQNNLSAQLDARHVLRQMVSELREASPSSLGAYPISTAGTSTLIFYSDVNNDGLKDKIRYFLTGSTLKRAIVVPTGSPLTYNDANEKLTSVVSNIVNGTSTPIFTYYDSSYTGTTSPLSQPVTVSSIRLVQIKAIIDKDSRKSPSSITVLTDVTLRNLKDNF